MKNSKTYIYINISWCRVNVVIAGIQTMERAREGVAVLLNDVWHNAVIALESCGLNSRFRELKSVR